MTEVAGLFMQVAELSVSAAWMIPAVCALRLLIRRAPRWGLCLLWLPVGLRLVWPFSFGSALSLIPRAASHAPGAVLSGGAGAQSADAAGSISGIAPHLYSDCSTRAYICLRICRSRSWASSWRTRGCT